MFISGEPRCKLPTLLTLAHWPGSCQHLRLYELRTENFTLQLNNSDTRFIRFINFGCPADLPLFSDNYCAITVWLCAHLFAYEYSPSTTLVFTQFTSIKYNFSLEILEANTSLYNHWLAVGIFMFVFDNSVKEHIGNYYCISNRKSFNCGCKYIIRTSTYLLFDAYYLCNLNHPYVTCINININPS